MIWKMLYSSSGFRPPAIPASLGRRTRRTPSPPAGRRPAGRRGDPAAEDTRTFAGGHPHDRVGGEPEALGTAVRHRRGGGPTRTGEGGQAAPYELPADRRPDSGSQGQRNLFAQQSLGSAHGSGSIHPDWRSRSTSPCTPSASSKPTSRRLKKAWRRRRRLWPASRGN